MPALKLNKDWMTWEGLIPGVGGALTADVVTSLDLEHQADVTNHAIAAPGKISDHIRFNPPTVQFDFAQSELPDISDDTLGGEVMWTRTPIDVPANRFRPQGLLALTMGAGAAIRAITGAAGLGGLTIWNLTGVRNEDRVIKIHDQILEVYTKAYKVTFAYKGLVLSDYYLTGVKLSRSNDEIGIARLSVTAQNVQTVQTSASSLLGGLAQPSVLRALPVTPLGKKPLKQVEAEIVSRANLGIGLDGDLP